MPQAEMLKQIWDEIRYVRKRLDDHVNDEDRSVDSLRKDMIEIKEEVTGHRVKIGMVLTVFGLILTGIISWVVNNGGQ